MHRKGVVHLFGLPVVVVLLVVVAFFLFQGCSVKNSAPVGQATEVFVPKSNNQDILSRIDKLEILRDKAQNDLFLYEGQIAELQTQLEISQLDENEWESPPNGDDERGEHNEKEEMPEGYWNQQGSLQKLIQHMLNDKSIAKDYVDIETLVYDGPTLKPRTGDENLNAWLDDLTLIDCQDEIKKCYKAECVSRCVDDDSCLMCVQQCAQGESRSCLNIQEKDGRFSVINNGGDVLWEKY